MKANWKRVEDELPEPGTEVWCIVAPNGRIILDWKPYIAESRYDVGFESIPTNDTTKYPNNTAWFLHVGPRITNYHITHWDYPPEMP
jgi:hypothetical protein